MSTRVEESDEAASRPRTLRPEAGEEAADAGSRPHLSAIVPVVERPEPLDELYREYAPAIESSVDGPVEFIFVAPSMHRSLLDPLRDMDGTGGQIRLLEVSQTVSEGALLKLAAQRARGELVLTLPPYHRVEAESLPDLVREVEEGVDLCVARRAPRQDSWINRIQNKLFHFLLRITSGGDVHDTACGVRVMKRSLLLDVPLYGDFFRFIPILAAQEGYRVREVDAPQHPDDAEPRIYSPGVYLRRLIDILGLFFLTRFAYKPLRFFGLLGACFAIGGGLTLLVVSWQRLVGGEALAERPALVLGVLILTLGVQAVALGLVGEIIVHFNAPERRGYRVTNESDDGQ